MRRYTDLLLRISLSFAFLYPPIKAVGDPSSWIGYIPTFAYSFWPWSHLALLHTFGVLEIVLALWLLSGRKAWIPAALMCFLLLFIVVTNVPQMDVVFRDLALAGLALALAIRHWPQRTPVVA